MQLEPPSLGVPLHPRQWFWLKALLVVAIVAVALLLLSPGFGIPYIASMLAVAPVLCPYLLSLRLQSFIRACGLAVRVGAFAAVVIYIAFAKKAIAPVLATWLQSVFG
jgi:hypothetical protein